MDTADRLISEAITVLDAIPSDIVLPDSENHETPSNVTTAPSTAPLMDNNVSAAAPPVSTTKGSRKKSTGAEEGPQPHFQRPKEKKKRKCKKCGMLAPGHNAATCDRVSKMQSEGVVKRPRGRPRGSGRGRGTVTLGGRGNDAIESVNDMDNGMRMRTRSTMMITGRGGGKAGSNSCSSPIDEYYSDYNAEGDGDEYASMSDD